jgi:hypothetical protein
MDRPFFYEPVPDNVTVCGLPAALSVTFKSALRAPVAVGLNVTLIVQLALAASELPHVLVCAKSPGSRPASVMLVIVIAVVPTFFRVAVMTELVVPTVTFPKLRLVGVSSAVVPVPLSGTCCGLPAALSVTVRFALRAPVVVGLNVRLTVQLAAAARELPQVVAVSGKSPASAPVTAMLLIVSVVVPMLVRVTFLTGLVKPTASVPNPNGVGTSLAVVPVPLNGTCCGLPAALSVMLTDALRAPVAEGLN